MTVGYTITFGSASSSGIPEVIATKIERRLLATTRDQWQAVPGRAGAWLFPEKPGVREITCHLLIVGDSVAARRAAVEDVADWLDTAGQERLVFSDTPDRFWWAKLSAPPDVDEWRQTAGSGLGIPVTFTADPYSSATALSTHSWSSTAASGSPETWTAPDGLESPPVVEITAVGGTIDGFVLTVNGAALTYTGTVDAGETVTVSSVALVLTEGANTDTDLTGDLDYSSVSMADVAGSFGNIAAGSNTITLVRSGGTATSATVTVTWRRRYRS